MGEGVAAALDPDCAEAEVGGDRGGAEDEVAVAKEGVAGDDAAAVEGGEGTVDADIDEIEGLVGDDEDVRAGVAAGPACEVLAVGGEAGEDRAAEGGGDRGRVVMGSDVGEGGGREGLALGGGQGVERGGVGEAGGGAGLFEAGVEGGLVLEEEGSAEGQGFEQRGLGGERGGAEVEVTTPGARAGAGPSWAVRARPLGVEGARMPAGMARDFAQARAFSARGLGASTRMRRARNSSVGVGAGVRGEGGWRRARWA